MRAARLVEVAAAAEAAASLGSLGAVASVGVNAGALVVAVSVGAAASDWVGPSGKKEHPKDGVGDIPSRSRSRKELPKDGVGEIPFACEVVDAGCAV